MKKGVLLLVLSLVGLTSIFANEYANKQQELVETSKVRMWTEWFAPKTKATAPKTKATDPNIERYLEMKMEVENLENELEQKDKVDLIGLLEKLTVEADEFFEREVLGWEEVEPDLKAWSNAIAAKKPATIEQANLEKDITSTDIKNKITAIIAKTAAKSFLQCFIKKFLTLFHISMYPVILELLAH